MVKEDMTVYTVTEVAEILKIHRDTLKRKIYKKEIEAFKVGREWRITKDSLMKFIENSYQ